MKKVDEYAILKNYFDMMEFLVIPFAGDWTLANKLLPVVHADPIQNAKRFWRWQENFKEAINKETVNILNRFVFV